MFQQLSPGRRGNINDTVINDNTSVLSGQSSEWYLRSWDRKPPTASRMTSLLSLINTMFGVSILSIPFAFSKCGCIIGFSILLFVTLLCGFSHHLLIVSVIKELEIVTEEFKRLLLQGKQHYGFSDSPGVSSFATLTQRTIPESEETPVKLQNPDDGSGREIAQMSPLLSGQMKPRYGLVKRKDITSSDSNPSPYNSPTRTSSFASLTKRTVPGDCTNYVVDFIILLNCFGCGSGYLVVMGDVIPTCMTYLGLKGDASSRLLWISVLSWLIAFPLCCFKSLKSLRVTSTINLGLFTFMLGAQIYFFLTSTLNDIDLNEIPPNLTLWDVLNACALFMNGFSMSYNLPQVVQELREHSIKRCDQVLNISCVFVMITYYVFSYTAFRLYGYDTQSNVIGNYPKNLLGIITRLALSFVLVCGVPFQLHPARNSLAHLLFGKEAHELSLCRYMTSTIVIFTAMYALSTQVTDLGMILGWVGAVCGTTLMCLLPPWFYIKLHKRRGNRKSVGVGTYKRLAKCVVVLGLVCIPLFSTANVV